MQFARCYAEYAELLVFARLLFFVIKFVWNVIILLGNDKHLLEERDVDSVISGIVSLDEFGIINLFVISSVDSSLVFEEAHIVVHPQSGEQGQHLSLSCKEQEKRISTSSSFIVADNLLIVVSNR
ncbi:hypothetical protein T01_7041 [Trichinella spiralis]|uniref:Uncharacterized protein n=1 Tax=Trichinella spiralis TaxID=6334 RepID=A0A0V1B0P8_TRISP|nr:hypothetical protein T01_14358 [Trichinella spiralis]KRY30576.1 hypothetical protein T01_7041 [Trichinella spiralis]